MANKDYYQILGVSKNASKDEIKKAFRTLAHKYHPDKGGDAEKFKEINEAYGVLSDDKKKASYDQFGSADAGAGFGGGNPFGGGFGGFDFSLGISTDNMRNEKKFDLIIRRIMGICSDPTKNIGVSGAAKLNDLDLIDDSFEMAKKNYTKDGEFQKANYEYYITTEVSKGISKFITSVLTAFFGKLFNLNEKILLLIFYFYLYKI